MTGKLLAGFIAGLGICLAVAHSSAAAPITWLFEGQINYIAVDNDETEAALSSLGVSLGSAFTGQLVFESTTTDEDPDPAWGTYPGAISFFSVTIGSFHQELSPSTSGQSVIYVFPVDPGTSEVSGWEARAYAPGVDPLVADPTLSLWVLETALNQIVGDALPAFPPGSPWSGDVTTTEYSELLVYTTLDEGGAGIGGILTEMAVVPEPGVAALVALAAIGMTAIRRPRAA